MVVYNLITSYESVANYNSYMIYLHNMLIVNRKMYEHISKYEIRELKVDHWNWLCYQKYHVGDLNCHWIVFLKRPQGEKSFVTSQLHLHRVWSVKIIFQRYFYYLIFGQPNCNLSSYNMHDNLQSFCTKLLGLIWPNIQLKINQI